MAVVQSRLHLKENSAHFLNMLRRIFNFELSSGAFSAIAAMGGALLEVSVDSVEAGVEGAGDGWLEEGPDDEDAIQDM